MVATGTRTHTRAELRGWRQFRTYWFGHLLSFTGDWFTVVALPIAALSIRNSAIYVGIVEFAELAATLLVGMRLGALADRLHPRRAMIAADVLRATVLCIVAVWISVDTPHVAVLPIAAFIMGSLRDLHDGAENVMVASVVPRRMLVRANGRFQISDGLGHLLGSLMAGASATVGVGLAIGIDAATFAIAALMVGAMGSFRVERHGDPALAPWRETRRAVRSEDRYWRVVAMMSIANITTVCFMGQFFPFARRELRLDNWQIGVTLAAMGLGSVLMGLALSRVSAIAPVGVLWATVVMAVATVTVGLARSWPVTLVAFVVLGGVMSIGMAALGSMRHRSFDVGLQGRIAMGTRVSLSLGVLPGVLVGGWAAEAIGSADMFVWFGGASLLATSVGLLLGVHRIPSERHVDRPDHTLNRSDEEPEIDLTDGASVAVSEDAPVAAAVVPTMVRTPIVLPLTDDEVATTIADALRSRN